MTIDQERLNAIKAEMRFRKKVQMLCKNIVKNYDKLNMSQEVASQLFGSLSEIQGIIKEIDESNEKFSRLIEKSKKDLEHNQGAATE